MIGVQAGMDDAERVAIRDEGYDPDVPAVVAALERVRAELERFRWAGTLDNRR